MQFNWLPACDWNIHIRPFIIGWRGICRNERWNRWSRPGDGLGGRGEGGLFCSAFQCTSQTEGPILHPAQLTFYTDACVVASLHPAQSWFPPAAQAIASGATALAHGEACLQKAEACSGADDTWCYFSDLKYAPLQLRNWSPNTWFKCVQIRPLQCAGS